MIGVISRPDEVDVVREFFQLFKTYWEFYKHGKSYDTVISSSSQIGDIDTKLLIVYDSDFGEFDKRHGLTLQAVHRNAFLDFKGTKLPTYGKTASIGGGSRSLLGFLHNAESAAAEISSGRKRIIRLGYDIFKEVAFLLSSGQPKENAATPTLELHISMIRNWIVGAGIPLVEIPPVPAGYDFIACLTHDVDFVRVRHHKFDHTMLGFVFRATFGSLLALSRRRTSWRRMLQNWKAAFSLPFVHVGLVRDFWLQFDRLLKIEMNLPSTFFLIPFKNRFGDKLNGRFSKKRATRYDVTDILDWTKVLLEQGKEIAVHGIDAWHDSEKGSQELNRISEVNGGGDVGVRVHWLCLDRSSFQVLDRAGFGYDSTFGYNNAIGYRAGTAQVFRPPGVRDLLELPLIIQDTAMFYPSQMALSEPNAWRLCNHLIQNARLNGGALTILWHLRSLAPERLWDHFYIKLLLKLQRQRTWFGTAKDVVAWFRKRRSISFESVSLNRKRLCLKLKSESGDLDSDFILRVYRPDFSKDALAESMLKYTDVPLNGQRELEIPLT